MISTWNTSRSNTNPPRMQDPPGVADSRPPDALEAMQANTDEVEALRLTNQRLIGELEQLTRQMQPPRRHNKLRKVATYLLKKENIISTYPEVLKQKQCSDPEPGPTRMASPNLNPGDARLILFIYILLRFLFQKLS